MADNIYTAKQFRDKKREAILKLVLHMRDPSHFGVPKVTLDDVAVLQAKTEKDVLSRMYVCKTEISALKKLRSRLMSSGIKSVADYIGNSLPATSTSYGVPA